MSMLASLRMLTIKLHKAHSWTHPLLLHLRLITNPWPPSLLHLHITLPNQKLQLLAIPHSNHLAFLALDFLPVPNFMAPMDRQIRVQQRQEYLLNLSLGLFSLNRAQGVLLYPTTLITIFLLQALLYLRTKIAFAGVSLVIAL